MQYVLNGLAVVGFVAVAALVAGFANGLRQSLRKPKITDSVEQEAPQVGLRIYKEDAA
jgi:hypothetical protein